MPRPSATSSPRTTPSSGSRRKARSTAVSATPAPDGTTAADQRLPALLPMTSPTEGEDDPAVPGPEAPSRGQAIHEGHSLTRKEINELPMRAYEGEICLVRNERELEVALNELWDEKVIGFDTETRPNFIKGVLSQPALVQLAGQKRVFLVQLTWVSFGKALAALLATPHIVKAGVAIRDDMRALERLYPFEAGAEADLAAMARARNIKAQGLRTLAAELMGIRISKSVQCSNWEKRELTPQQIRYAATDAWLGRELYRILA